MVVKTAISFTFVLTHTHTYILKKKIFIPSSKPVKNIVSNPPITGTERPNRFNLYYTRLYMKKKQNKYHYKT